MVDKQKLLDAIWGKVLTVTVEMEYSKSKVLKAKYDTYADIWNEVREGKYDVGAVDK